MVSGKTLGTAFCDKKACSKMHSLQC